MGKKYVMFVDERGVIGAGKKSSLSMIGVIFEYDYCINLKNIECELRKKLNKYREEVFGSNYFNIPIDNILLKEDVYKSINEIMISKFVNELPILLEKLKFTVISSEVKQDSNKINDLYSIAAKKLLKKFHSFIIKNNGKSGGIIIECKGQKSNNRRLQNFFDIYNERNINLNMISNIQGKINTFIVCEKNNRTYGSGIEILNIINNIFFRVSNGYSEIDEKLRLHINYHDRNKIFNEIKHKVYNDIEIGISSNQLQDIYYMNSEGFNFNRELKILKEQLMLKEARIEENEKEISELTNKIQSLTQQLEKVLLNRKGDNIISRILSDVEIEVI